MKTICKSRIEHFKMSTTGIHGNDDINDETNDDDDNDKYDDDENDDNNDDDEK